MYTYNLTFNFNILFQRDYKSILPEASLILHGELSPVWRSVSNHDRLFGRTQVARNLILL